MDFIGEISPSSSSGFSWILVAIDYFTKWIEAIPTRNLTSKVVNNFLLSNIITRFECPERIVTDNAMCFRSEEFIKFYKKNMTSLGQFLHLIIHKGMDKQNLQIRVY